MAKSSPTELIIEEIIRKQQTEPVLLTSMGCDNVLDEGNDVFNALHLKPGQGDNGEFYPLTDQEWDYVGEDSSVGPYGGAMMSYAALYLGKKYLAPTVEICFDSDDRPFSLTSYGKGSDCIYENSKVACEEARRLIAFLRPKMDALGGAIHLSETMQIDRHGVMMLFPAHSVVGTFGMSNKPERFHLFKGLVGGLFKGYTPRRSSIII